MAWYEGTFSCGHEGRVNVIGPTKDREWKIERKFSGLCPECYEKHITEEKEKRNQEAALKAEEMELVDLIGTEKQVIWANTLRIQMIERIGEVIELLKSNDRNTLLSLRHNLMEDRSFNKKVSIEIKEGLVNYTDVIIDYMIENKTQSSFYINNRTTKILDIILDLYFEIKKEEDKDSSTPPEDIIVENTIAPEEVNHEGIVEVTATDARVSASYMKNDDFIRVVKSLKYKWNDGAWRRELTESTGSYIDRASELVNKLLNAGFRVYVENETIREKGISGDYEQECTNWIFLRTSGENKGKLAIYWEGKNDRLYNLSRKLPGSKWDGGTVVKVDYYKEVQEFAELYGFKLSTAAQNAINNYIEQLNKIAVVDPAVVEKVQQKDGLKDILNSSTEVLDDLKED